MHCAIRSLLGSLLLCGIADARADLVADPGQLAFPLGVVGDTSEPLYVTLTNTGGTALNVVSLTSWDEAYARAGGSCGTVPFALAAQASCTLGYTFTPIFAGPTIESVRATPDVGNFVDFVLSGVAVTGALATNPGQLVFPLQALGATAGPLHVTLGNISNVDVTVVSLTPASGAYARAGGSCGAVPFAVAAQSSCTLGYTFTPVDIGMAYQTITATPAVGESVAFGLAGEGDVGRLLVEPRTIHFLPPIAVGEISQESFAVLENSGRVPMDVTAIVPSDVPSVLSFLRTGGTCPEPPFTMLASSSCTVGYTFAPAAVGVVELDMQFHNTTASPEIVTLRGEGLQGDIFADGFDAI